MTQSRRPFQIALLMATLHCAIGNVVGVSNNEYLMLNVLFLPYSFIAGLSAFAGWDLLSLILEIAGFGIMLLIFYPLGLLIARKRTD